MTRLLLILALALALVPVAARADGEGSEIGDCLAGGQVEVRDCFRTRDPHG